MTQLLILGGGPAACAAAIFARSRGLSVRVIDIPKRSRRLPGETVHPGVEPLLKQLDVWEDVLSCGFHRHTGIWREGLNGDRNFDEYGRDDTGAWQGFQLDRILFHKILREQAIRLGVDWIETKDISLSLRDDQGWVIDTSSGLVNAELLIDATGRKAWLADQIGLTPEFSTEIKRLHFGWEASNDKIVDSNPLFIQFEDGWDWISPIAANLVAWVRLRNGSCYNGLDVTPRIFRECAGKNWFLIGDAACLTTPASGNGILRALMSGILAAHHCVAISSRCISSEDGVKAYRSWIGALWESSVLETSFSNAPKIA
ncbi:MAG: NAD(P)/FAD-dependent oxidoreductase [Pirellula sp.]